MGGGGINCTCPKPPRAVNTSSVGPMLPAACAIGPANTDAGSPFSRSAEKADDVFHALTKNVTEYILLGFTLSHPENGGSCSAETQERPSSS